MASLRIVLVASLLAAPPALRPTAAAAQSHPVDALAWMAGCWARTAPDRSYEEQWMAPRGGAMLGVSRTVRDGRATGHEFLRIFERDGGLVYHAVPSGQAPTDFAATRVGHDAVTFENPAHDFPTRIVYRRGDADSLWARAEGPRPDGSTAGADFRMAREDCP